MTPLTKYKYVKYDTGGGYIREGLEPHADGEWMKAADLEAVLKDIWDEVREAQAVWQDDRGEFFRLYRCDTFDEWCRTQAAVRRAWPLEPPNEDTKLRLNKETGTIHKGEKDLGIKPEDADVI